MRRSIRHLFANAITQLRFGEPIIVVSGLPRSGTSMLMNMLQAGGVKAFVDDLRQADLDNVKGYFEHERVKGLETEPDKSWLRSARGKAIKVVSHLLRSLPSDNRYLVLLATRDLAEVLASQNRMLARLNQVNPVADEKALRLYKRHLQSVRSLVAVRSNFRMLEVPYTGVINAVDVWSRRIAAFVGRDLDQMKMVAVVDSSLYRSRVKDGGLVVHTADSGAAK